MISPPQPPMTAPSSSDGQGTASAPLPAGTPPPGGRVARPWGWFENLALGSSATGVAEGYVVKRLWIAPGCRISLQRHHHRCEHWVVVAGGGVLECGDGVVAAQPGTTLFVPLGTLHRARAGAEGLLIVEVQRGDELREDDIERVADDYGRVVS